MAETLEDKIETYLKSDRQWHRSLRIQHAEYRKKIAKTKDEKKFWNEIIQRNKVE